MRTSGTLVKDLPKEPPCKTKAELEKEMGLGDESDEEDVGDDE